MYIIYLHFVLSKLSNCLKITLNYIIILVLYLIINGFVCYISLVIEYSTGQYGTGGGGVAGGYGGYPAYGVPPPGPPSYQQPSVPQPQQTQQPQGYPGTGGWNQPPPPPTAASQGIFKFLLMTYSN